jgi:hypothetical protein
MRSLLLSLALLFALAMTRPAWTAEVDLVAQQERYGWDAVALIVRQMASGDVGGSEVQRRVRKAGIGRLELPMVLHPSVAGRFRRASALKDCRWSYGVACVFTVEALQLPGTGQWGVRCVRRGEPVQGVFLEAKVENIVQIGDHAIVHVEDMLGCWEKGGDAVQVVEGPPLKSAADPEFDGAPTVAGLPATHVREVIGRIADPSMDCYLQSPRLPRTDRGWVVLGIEVGASGRVSTARIDQTTLDDPSVERCLLGLVGKLVFDAPDGGTASVVYPLWFGSSVR